MKGLERMVEVKPAYDRRNPDPARNYGVHGADLMFILKGSKGAVQFVIYTNWQLPHVQREMERQCLNQDNLYLLRPMGADVGYHSPLPQYEGHHCMGSCPYLDGSDCYYDGSTLAGEDLLVRLIAEGESAVWQELERVYQERFVRGSVS